MKEVQGKEGPIPSDGTERDVIREPTRTDEIRLHNRMLKPLFQDEVPEFWEWIKSLSRFGNNPIDAMVLDRKHGGTYIATLYTGMYKYTITANKYEKSYLGATMSFRKPRAGEDWTRGSDLADGSYSGSTWSAILADIVAVELVRLGK